MTESIHIFDGFPNKDEGMTPELRHKKRLELEPLVFDILKRKYGSVLKGIWDMSPSVKDGDRAFVLVERRIHPNIEFVLQTARAAGISWRIFVVCSDINLPWLQETLGDKVELFPFFKGLATREVALQEYCSMMTDASFYQALPAEHLFFLQTDSYIRRAIPDSLLQYDLAAAPYLWDETIVGGGTSFRKRSAMIQICNKAHRITPIEDVFISAGAKELGFKIPSFDEGITYIAESCLYEDPIAVHQWWTFFFTTYDDAEDIFHSLLTLPELPLTS